MDGLRPEQQQGKFILQTTPKTHQPSSVWEKMAENDCTKTHLETSFPKDTENRKKIITNVAFSGFQNHRLTCGP